MKRSVNTEYFKCVISAFKSKLNANVFQAVPRARYGVRIIQWTKKELQ